jgi:hypothetical protein
MNPVFVHVRSAPLQSSTAREPARIAPASRAAGSVPTLSQPQGNVG